MRITSKGKGKSGGARVITFTVVAAVDETEINLLYIYDKAERESVTAAEIEELLRKNGLRQLSMKDLNLRVTVANLRFSTCR